MDEKINFIRHYQNSIEKSKDNLERVLHCLKKLQNLRINVQDLQETGIGKTVNSLREIDGEVGELASALVTKWKQLINSKFLIFPHKKFLLIKVSLEIFIN
jgi:transcription elongation factor B polypeptide 3